MNGLEATVELHQHYPELTVIILTAHDLPTLRDACIQHGAYGFVTKGQLGRQLLRSSPTPQYLRRLKRRQPRVRKVTRTCDCALKTIVSVMAMLRQLRTPSQNVVTTWAT